MPEMTVWIAFVVAELAMQTMPRPGTDMLREQDSEAPGGPKPWSVGARRRPLVARFGFAGSIGGVLE